MSNVVSRSRGGIALALAGISVLAGQLLLVALAGTDIPFQDQWDAEGRSLYPGVIDGTLKFGDLFTPHNEHRIVWTHLLNWLLFDLNGQRWDPLLQQLVGALLHGVVAMQVAGLLTRGQAGTRCGLIAGLVALTCLPLTGWHNALWGFQSQVYLVLIGSLAAMHLLTDADPGSKRWLAGVAAALAAQLAMGAGAFVPVALVGLCLLRIRAGRTLIGPAATALGLFMVALLLRVDTGASDGLRPSNSFEFFRALLRMLAWPHTDQPLAAIVLNLPLLWLGLRRGRAPWGSAPAIDGLLAMGLWAGAAAVAVAWTRGGSPELAVGAPSRYADFMLLLPLANLGSLWLLWRTAMEERRTMVRFVAIAWSLFLAIGWLGLSAQAVRGVVIPRIRDRDAPVRLARAFQQSGDDAVFVNQPRLLIPHPDLGVVRVVLADPRLEGALPPSLQPREPQGVLSRAARWFLRRDDIFP
ncbi:MAG TPA: hypothetical protein VGD88_12035 [Opitutaceae bacterium]